MPVTVQSIRQRLAAGLARGQRQLEESVIPWVKQHARDLSHRLQEAWDQARPVIERLRIAWGLGVRILSDPEFAGQIAAHLGRASKPSVAHTPPTTAVEPKLQETPPDSALVLLSLLQKEGRFVDFIQEDIRLYSDEEVGRGARVVHQGCRKVLAEYLTLAPVRDEPEGSRITLQPGFDASAIRPTGNLVGGPPFTGTLAHRGWRVIETRLPKIASGHDPHIIAAAEVEL